MPGPPAHSGELRLLLEELCCDLCRFEHVTRDGLAAEAIRIDREHWLGAPGAYADIRAERAGQAPYFVEVKTGYSSDTVVRHLARKYRTRPRRRRYRFEGRARHRSSRACNWIDLERQIEAALRPGLDLEIWDEGRLLALLADRFGVGIPQITPDNLLDVRQAIDRAKGFHAFGGRSLESDQHDPLKAQLLWHFGFWRLKQLRAAGCTNPRDILPPATYRGVAVVLADMCSFSSYMRDTSDSEIVRESLTAFYSKARYQIINSGGMLYQFVGDQVIGLFGVPDHLEGFAEATIDTSRCPLPDWRVGVAPLAAAHRLRAGRGRSPHWRRARRSTDCRPASLQPDAHRRAR